MLLVFAMAYGQDETSNWYFGRGAGLKFNNDGSVIPLTDGKLSTEEGCASISNDKGTLLFYTDGIRIYNGNHELMENGSGLYGDPSSTQSAIIVPAPLNDVLFYIFTVDTSIREDDPDYGFNYSIVDISKNSGKGAVVEKNISLLRTCSEKIAAVVKDCSDESVWVLTLSTLDGTGGLSDTFHAFEVNDKGVNTTSVKSRFDNTFGDQRGYLKLSSDGKKMASANEFDGLFLYDFNAKTGAVSNSRKITINAPYKNPYSVEFSPSNQYLYVHSHSDAPALENGHNSNLLQYDLFSTDISASEIILDQKNIYRGALQLGTNGKIYRTITDNYLTGTQYLGVINDPNQKGTAANYEHNAIFLDGGIAMQGLPPFVQSFFSKKGLIKNPDGSTNTSATFCNGDEIVLEAENLPGATYLWEHDGVAFNNPENHLLLLKNLSIENAGQYRLTITPADASKCEIINEALIQVNELPVANDYTLVQCDSDEEQEAAGLDGFTIFNLEQAIEYISPSPDHFVSFYRTLDDLIEEKIIVNISEFENEVRRSQIIYVKVTDENGCSNEAQLTLEVSPTATNESSNYSYYACAINSSDSVSEGIFNLKEVQDEHYSEVDVFFYQSRKDAALELNAINENNYKTVSTTIYARSEIMNQCLGIEKLELIVNPIPIVDLESEFLVCTNNPDLQIYAEEGFDTYAWYRINGASETNISNDISVDIIDPGEYRLEIGRYYADETELCTNSASFRVLPSNNSIISNIKIEDLQENNKVTIIATGDGDYEYAIGNELGPYQDSPIIENVLPGETMIYVRDKNGCGLTKEKVSIIGFPKFFTPNGDGINESWNLIGISEEREIAVSIYDRYGKLVYMLSSNDQNGWNGNINGRALPASDYWFMIEMEKGRIYKGHFTLKR